MRPALRRFVARADDRRLERLFGSDPALRLIFRAAERAYVPADVTAEVAFVLDAGRGAVRPWTLALTPVRARARAGRPAAPALTLELGVADLVRIGAGVLDADEALLDGRLDLVGELALALRLPALFGRS